MPAKKKINQEVDYKELAEMSGESSVRRFRFSVPILKFNGNSGKFTLLIPDDSGNWVPQDLPEKIEITVLKVRRVLSSYQRLPDGSGIRTFTNEHNTWKDPLTVFEKKKGDAKPRMLDAGSSDQVRKNFPELRLRQNLYCLLGEQVVKLSVKGKSLSALFDYYQKFSVSEHIFQYISNLSAHPETNEGGLTYYVLDWEKGSESDISLVAGKIKEIKEALDLQDQQYAESKIPPELKPELEEGEGSRPTAEADGVEVKDIPF